MEIMLLTSESVMMNLLPFSLLPIFKFIFVIFVTYLVIHLFKITSNAKRVKKVGDPPPGCCGLPLVGETFVFVKANHSSKGFYDFVQKRRARYGNCLKTKIFGDTHAFVSSIESAKAILGSKCIDFSKRYMKSIAALLGDQSLLCASHEQHRVIHRRISNLFAFHSMTSTIKMVDEFTVKTLDSWKQEQSLSVLNDALMITFRAICKMLASLDDEDEIEMLQKDVSKVTEAMLAFPSKFPGTRFYRGLKARRRIMSFLKEKVALRRKGSEFHDDFLQSFLKDESINFELSKDSPILDNILTLIIAGFQVKKGWIVNIDARALHFDPAVYDEPLCFNPSRFEDDPKPYAFLAFGVGGRTCIGMNIAKSMMLILLHRLVTTYRWRVTDPDSSLEK